MDLNLSIWLPIYAAIYIGSQIYMAALADKGSWYIRICLKKHTSTFIIKIYFYETKEPELPRISKFKASKIK